MIEVPELHVFEVMTFVFAVIYCSSANAGYQGNIDVAVSYSGVCRAVNTSSSPASYCVAMCISCLRITLSFEFAELSIRPVAIIFATANWSWNWRIESQHICVSVYRYRTDRRTRCIVCSI